MFFVNNTAAMRAAKLALEELKMAGIIRTTVFKYDVYGEVQRKEVILNPDGRASITCEAITRIAKYGNLQALWDEPAVFLFVRPVTPFQKNRHEDAVEWEAYQAWVAQAVGGSYFVYNRVKTVMFAGMGPLHQPCWNVQRNARRLSELVTPPEFPDWREYFFDIPQECVPRPSNR